MHCPSFVDHYNFESWKAHAQNLEQEKQQLSEINQQNLYFLGSALGAASEERMSRYALLAYIGSIFAVLNKKFGKDAVRQMLSLDTPDMVRELKEKLAEVEEWAKEGALEGIVEVDTKSVLKNPHIMRGYQETIGVYEKGVGRSVTPKLPQSQGAAFELDSAGARKVIQNVENARMPS